MARAKYGEARRFLDELAALPPQSACVIWPYARTSAGYGNVRIGGKNWVVSRLVCEAVHGTPPTEAHEAAHSCGNGHLGCVNPWCLYWATHSVNQRERVRHGTDGFGEKNPASKLSSTQVAQIINSRGVVTGKALAAAFGVSKQQITKIQLGQCRVNG